MKNVLMLANFPSGKRYKGGITYVAEKILEKEDLFKSNGISITKFNTEMLDRKISTQNTWAFENIINGIVLTKRVLQDVKTRNFQSVYIHTGIGLGLVKFCYLIRKLKKEYSGEIILHIHFAEYVKIMPSNIKLQQYVLNTLINYVDKIVFLSVETKKEFIQKGVNSDKCFVLYNFHTGNKMLTDIHYNQELQLLFIGSIDKRKGILDLFEALRNIEIPYKLHVAGKVIESDMEPIFESKLREFGSRVVYHGYVSGLDKDSLLNNADILVLPSYGEGLPIVIFEAMASRCAIIATSVGAIPEVIKNGEDGILVIPGNTESLKQSIESLGENEEVLLKLKQNSYRRAKEFSLESFINKMIRILV